MKSLIRPTLGGVAVRAVGASLALGVSAFLARTLGAGELGAYQATLSICIVLASLAIASGAQPATRRIAALQGGDARGLAHEVALAHFLAGIVLFGLEVVLVSAAALGVGAAATRDVLWLVALVVPGVAVLALRQWIALPLRGAAGSLSPEQIGLPIVFVALAAAVAGQDGLVASEALVAYAAACWLVWIVTCWRSGLLALLFDGLRGVLAGSEVHQRLRQGRPFVLLSLVGMVPVYAAVPLVAGLLDLESAGVLAIAAQFAGVVALPLQIVSLTVMPRCAQLHRDGDVAGINRLVRAASTLSLGAGLGIAVGLALLLDVVLGVLGSSFAASGRLLAILVVGQLFNVLLGPNGPALQMIGRERDLARTESLTTVPHVATVAAAAWGGSLVGVAVAMAATNALRNVLLYATLYRKSGILTLPNLPRRRVNAR